MKELEKYTISEVIEYYFKTSPEIKMFEVIVETSLEMYLKDNQQIKLAISRIESLEIKYSHYCTVTDKVKDMFRNIPLPPELIEEIISIVEQHMIEEQ